MFYELAPEVAGHFGSETVIDASTHPPIVHALHYEFDGWLGDELLEMFPCFIVTDHMKQLIEAAGPTGYSFDLVKVTASDEFRQLFPNCHLPALSWLRVTGVARQDDFGISADNGLVVSERMLHVLKRGRLEHCDVSAA